MRVARGVASYCRIGCCTRQRHDRIVHGAVTDSSKCGLAPTATLPSTLRFCNRHCAALTFLTYYLVLGRKRPIQFANVVAEQEVVS